MKLHRKVASSIALLSLISTPLWAMEETREVGDPVFFNKVKQVIHDKVSERYGRNTNNPLAIGMGLTEIKAQEISHGWLKKPNTWFIQRYAQTPRSSDGVKLKDLINDFLYQGEEKNSEALLKVCLDEDCGIETTNYHFLREREKIIEAIGLVHPRAVDAFKNHPAMKNLLGPGILTEDVVLEEYKAYLKDPTNPYLKVKMKTVPYCYLDHYLQNSSDMGDYMADGRAHPNKFNNKLEESLAKIYLNYADDCSAYMLAKAQGLLRLLEGSTFDFNEDSKNGGDWSTFEKLRMDALNLNLKAFDHLIASYRFGYFGIPNHPKMKEEAAGYLSLFALTGSRHYVEAHATSLVEGWFGVVWPKGLLVSESMSLMWYGTISEKAEKLLKLPPFVNPVITLKSLGKEKVKKNKKDDECVLQ